VGGIGIGLEVGIVLVVMTLNGCIAFVGVRRAGDVPRQDFEGRGCWCESR